MQVLGDILESISGAILVDSRLRLDVVWEKIKPILSPIVTPQNVELQPLRELHELCAQKHYKYNWMTITKKGNVNEATVKIEVKESIVFGEGSDVFGEGSDINKRFAKTKAAKHALAKLKVTLNIVCGKKFQMLNLTMLTAIFQRDSRLHLMKIIF